MVIFLKSPFASELVVGCVIAHKVKFSCHFLQRMSSALDFLQCFSGQLMGKLQHKGFPSFVGLKLLSFLGWSWVCSVYLLKYRFRFVQKDIERIFSPVLTGTFCGGYGYLGRDWSKFIPLELTSCCSKIHFFFFFLNRWHLNLAARCEEILTFPFFFSKFSMTSVKYSWARWMNVPFWVSLHSFATVWSSFSQQTRAAVRHCSCVWEGKMV